MTKSRKDNKGRVLRKGETVRSSNGMYQYAYTDAFGKRQFIYANDLLKLRQKEEEILRDRLDGINSEQTKNRSLNDVFDKYITTRKDLAARTYASYMYQYDAYVRETIGKRKIKDIKYSDVLLFYLKLSVKNSWFDDENRAYIYYTTENIMENLGCARAACAKVIAELDSKKGIGLIEKKRQGL